MTAPPFAAGDVLPALAIPLDRTLIVATAIASQDFEDVHHDPAAAQGRGTPDIFMSINATNGFIDRYLTDWTGPGGRIRSVSLRLGVPNFPGDIMTIRGEITSVDVAVDGAVVTIRVVGSNGCGNHVTATAVVLLPAESCATTTVVTS